MSWTRPWILLLLVALLLISWWHWRPEPGEVRRTRLLMGTVVEIVAVGPDRERTETAVAAAFEEMTRLERRLSSHLPESDVSRISASPGPAVVDAETAEVIALGLELARQSGGAFDLTLGRLKRLWGLDGDAPRVPDAAEIEAAIEGIGPAAVSLEGRRVRKRSAQLQVDLGGIAKGYIVDRAVDLLRRRDVSSAAVNAGGDMYLLGERNGRPWRIGIQDPRQPDQVIATVAVADRAVVTSGDYERYFVQDGVRYHHLFDPATGRPASRCRSVTVLADDVALGDGLATAIFILGPQAGLALLREYPGTEALIVAADGTLNRSPGWTAAEVR